MKVLLQVIADAAPLKQGMLLVVDLTDGCTDADKALTVADNLRMGSLRHHCHVRGGKDDPKRVELWAESPCGCFGRDIAGTIDDKKRWHPEMALSIQLPISLPIVEREALGKLLLGGKLTAVLVAAHTPSTKDAQAKADADAEAKRQADEAAAAKAKADAAAAEKAKADAAAKQRAETEVARKRQLEADIAAAEARLHAAKPAAPAASPEPAAGDPQASQPRAQLPPPPPSADA